ncbi:MAG: hypothetical protein Q9223_000778 [Gallowayella weberi]
MSVSVVEGVVPTTLRTIKEHVTLDFALGEEHDMLRRLLHFNKRGHFLGYLLHHAAEIEAVVAHHLGLGDPTSCRLSVLDDWVHGSFNMCVPVHVKRWGNQAEKRVMIRFPLCYKVGEEDFPGNAEEKLREGTLTADRPLSIPLHELENGGTPTSIGKKDTYTAIDPYALDLLTCHENRVQYQPNSIIDEPDARYQMAAITGLRVVLPHFIQRDSRHGPYRLSLTDLHQSNVYVDEDWHIKHIIDLEWACSLPIQMQIPPFWLTSRGIDQLVDEHLTEYEQVLEEFMEAFHYEEMLQDPNNATSRTEILRSVWQTGAFFFFSALDSPTGLFNVWSQHIKPRFSSIRANMPLSQYWSSDTESVITMKLKDRDEYDKKLKALFEVDDKTPPPHQ